MITEKDLQEAIAECQGERSPNANTCIKLAAYYTILNQIRPTEPVWYSTAGPRLNSDSEFAQVVNGLPEGQVWPVMEELMETIQTLYPRLYAGVMRQLNNRV